MGDKNLMEKMIKKILSFYTGKKVLSYEKDRNNEKWKFEQSFVENFIKKNSDINSIRLSWDCQRSAEVYYISAKRCYYAERTSSQRMQVLNRRLRES